jgi:hypothetical protein
MLRTFRARVLVIEDEMFIRWALPDYRLPDSNDLTFTRHPTPLASLKFSDLVDAIGTTTRCDQRRRLCRRRGLECSVVGVSILAIYSM